MSVGLRFNAVGIFCGVSLKVDTMLTKVLYGSTFVLYEQMHPHFESQNFGSKNNNCVCLLLFKAQIAVVNNI